MSLYKLSPLTPQEMKISFLTSHPFTYSSTTGLHYVSISLFFLFLSVCLQPSNNYMFFFSFECSISVPSKMNSLVTGLLKVTAIWRKRTVLFSFFILFYFFILCQTMLLLNIIIIHTVFKMEYFVLASEADRDPPAVMLLLLFSIFHHVAFRSG